MRPTNTSFFHSILNKITPEKFQKLSQELLVVGLDSPAILKGVILLCFDKALEEPKYSSMYAHLCRILSEKGPNFEPSNAGPNVSQSTFVETKCNKTKSFFLFRLSVASF